MNVWLRDPRIERAEIDSFEAERAERRGDFSTARARHHAAAEAYAAVAIGVPADHPNTRTDLSIAAVASFARAGDFGRAIEFGRRVLAEYDALTTFGRTELRRLVLEYESIVPPHPSSSSSSASPAPRANRSMSVRAQVRDQFRRAA